MTRLREESLSQVSCPKQGVVMLFSLSGGKPWPVLSLSWFSASSVYSTNGSITRTSEQARVLSTRCWIVKTRRMSHPTLAKSQLLYRWTYESNVSLYTPVTLDSTSYLPWPLEGNDLHKQQSSKTKHYKTPQSTGKKKSGLTPHMPYEQVKSKYAPYTLEISIGTCPIGMMKECISL